MSSFEKAVRVYYEDTDAGGVVYHANYLKFMERCRTDWLDSLGFSIAYLEKKEDLIFVVKEASLIYHQPARLFDDIRVSCSALHVGKVKLELEQKIYNQSQLLCSATIKLATLHKTSFKLTAMPAELCLALQSSDNKTASGCSAIAKHGYNG